MKFSPKEYGLSSRIQLEEIEPNHLAIVKKVKSRIIQKDALKLIDNASKIKETNPKVKVSLICHNNICSKSIVLLQEHDIAVIYSE